MARNVVSVSGGCGDGDTSEMPSREWSLERLGEFTCGKGKLIAREMWFIGKAMVIAKDKCLEDKENGKKLWSEWQRNYQWSAASVSRYTRLSQYYKDPEELRGSGLVEALEEAGIPTKSKKKQEQKGNLPWAVGEENENLPLLSDGFGSQVALRAELQTSLRQAVSELEQRLEWVVKCGPEAIQAAVDPDTRQFFVSRAARVRELLNSLEATIREDRRAA